MAEIRREAPTLRADPARSQVNRAADLALEPRRAGKTVWASNFAHVLDQEVFVDSLSPIKAFRGIGCGPNGEAFPCNLKEGDLLFWFGEWTVNLPWPDYLKLVRAT